VKNLVKLSHGEYIPLESLESKFKNSSYVDNICVYADSNESFCVALVFPSKNKLMEWAEKNGVPHEDWEALCKNRKARNIVLRSLFEIGKSQSMKSYELPKDVYLTPEEWTPANGLLTAAMKIKRAPIAAQFKNEIAEMYKANRE